MSNKKLAILGIITACMIAWAIVQSYISNSKTGPKVNVPTYLIQGLDPYAIDSIVVGTGDKSINLKRMGNQFVVANKDNYPATTSDINSLITSCTDIQSSELYTDNPGNHKDLGVEEEEAKTIVKFLKPDSSVLAGIIIGNSREMGRGSYVRLLPGNNVYVTQEVPWIKDQANYYINKDLIRLGQEDIESVTVNTSGESYTLKTKEGSDEIVLEGLPAGKKLKENDYISTFNALTGLAFMDVKAKSKAAEGLLFDNNYICRLKDSTVYTINIAQKDETTYITCRSEFADKAPITKGEGVESEEELKKKEAKLLARDKSDKFSAKHKNWIYEIPNNTAENLTKKLSDLLEDES